MTNRKGTVVVAAYYNEIDPNMAAWLRQLIKERLIADGEVDERDIKDVQGPDLAGFGQCHFFAGIGGWSYALRLAGWEDDRPIWTGSCPCQPFSIAGKGAGIADVRHLWPEFYRLIKEQNPSTIFGEQVFSQAGLEWADRVGNELEAIDYSFAALVLQGTLAGAPHQRDRLYFVADAGRTDSARRPSDRRRVARPQEMGKPWGFANWNGGMPKPDMLVDGLSRGLAKSIVGGFGNAIIPQLAAEFIAAADAALVR